MEKSFDIINDVFQSDNKWVSTMVFRVDGCSFNVAHE